MAALSKSASAPSEPPQGETGASFEERYPETKPYIHHITEEDIAAGRFVPSDRIDDPADEVAHERA